MLDSKFQNVPEIKDGDLPNSEIAPLMGKNRPEPV